MKDVGAGERGRLQEMGSRLMKGHVADKDSFLTTFFKKAGLVLLGRTTTPEFAMGISTESMLNGATRNPWNLELMAGGSSGGAAASVASGIAPIAHGSDNGGSIRIPASVCGLVGLKPSLGRVSLGPARALYYALTFTLTRALLHSLIHTLTQRAHTRCRKPLTFKKQ